jgi:hypothetical protein
MTVIDEQMRRWSTRLWNDLKIVPPESDALASSIAEEVSCVVVRVQGSSPGSVARSA